MHAAKGLIESAYIVPCYLLYPALTYVFIFLAHPTSLLAVPTHIRLLRVVTQSPARWTRTAGARHSDSRGAGAAKADAEAKYVVCDRFKAWL